MLSLIPIFQLQSLDPSQFSLVGMTMAGYGESTPPGRTFTNFYREDAEDAVELMKTLGFDKSDEIMNEQ